MALLYYLGRLHQSPDSPVFQTRSFFQNGEVSFDWPVLFGVQCSVHSGSHCVNQLEQQHRNGARLRHAADRNSLRLVEGRRYPCNGCAHLPIGISLYATCQTARSRLCCTSPTVSQPHTLSLHTLTLSSSRAVSRALIHQQCA